VAERAIVSLRNAGLRFGDRTLWQHLDLTVGAGEFLAVLGPNGAGKTSLLRIVLGLRPLSAGSVRIDGQPPRRGNPRIGYVPQQRNFDRDLMLRGRDFVRLGLDGHRYGIRWSDREQRAALDRAIATVGAEAFVNAPIGTMSGGEQQRLRVAQALLGNPSLLLCDEPLLSLDLRQQQTVIELIDQRRREHRTGVVLITHEINPVLPYVDRVLYLVGGRSAVGPPAEVMTSQRLSELYQAPIDVLHVRGRLVVVGAPDVDASAHHSEDAPNSRGGRG
jgi:zinc/manganese transport system ATP-binding protein